MPAPMGLIAGSGRLPLLVADGIHAAGREVVCVGFHDMVEPDLPDRCDRFASVGLVQIGRWAKLLKKFGAQEAVMVGRVQKLRMHDPLYLVRQIPDLRAMRLWFSRLVSDRRTSSILSTVADEMERLGVPLIDSTTFIKDHLAPVGVVAGEVSESQRAAIDFAAPVLRELGALNIGQSLAATAEAIIAVEAVEGTDRMIARAGRIAGQRGWEDWTLLKMAEPDQDMRFDVPTVGPATIERLHACGGDCLAIEAGRVILLEREKMRDLAKNLGVTITGISH